MRKTVTAAVLTAALTALSGCGLGGPRTPPPAKQIDAPKPPPAPPKVRNVPLDPQLRADAKAELISIFNGSDEELRANSIEAAQNTLGAGAHAIIEAGLRDNSFKVRHSACIAAGMLKLTDLHDDVLGLAFDSNRSVQLAARFALHRMGDTHLSHDFEKTARDPNPRVRDETAFLLGLLGDKSALKLLKDMSRDPDVLVREAVAEAQWRLGDSSGIEVLVGGATSANVQLRLLSMIGLAGPKDSRVAGNLQGELTADETLGAPEISLVAARCLGDVGSDDGYAIAAKYIRAADPRLRSLAAIAFGSIGRSDAQDYLRPLLKDADARVRLAAATGILELKAPLTF